MFCLLEREEVTDSYCYAVRNASDIISLLEPNDKDER